MKSGLNWARADGLFHGMAGSLKGQRFETV
jgi:hypothetical protein